jgi:sec-independent protein translocase protein TatC
LFLPISLALFWSGALLAFFFAFDYVLAFLFGFNRALNIQAELRISEWVGFVLFLPLGFGIAFQLPLVMFFLNRVGIFSIQAYIEKWRISILVIFVISMVLTPADPVSMLLMAFPLSLLYFLGIAMAKWMPRGRSPFVDAYDV